MANQLRFEGTELEDVLERVRNEVGPDARIVGANRIRKGGFGGFFAKEGYEVVVDVSARTTSPNGATSGARERTRVAASVLDLADEVSTQERDQVIDLSEPTLSTQSNDFGAMLERLSRELDEEEASFRLPDRPLPSFDDPVAPQMHYRRTTAEPPVTPPAPAAARQPVEDMIDLAPPPPMPTPAPPQPAPAPPAPSPTPAPFVAPAVAPPPARAPRPNARLLSLGLPPELVPSDAARTDFRSALVQRLAQLPAPPPIPRTSGVVIAVVGIGTAPIALARRLADELDVNPDHLMLASPESVSDVSHPDDAEAFRRSCRRRQEPTIIACSIGPGRAQLGWAHRILDRLEPTITWAVVEASCKPEDIEHRIELLGGVDVVALTNVADTVSPAAVLTLDVPVGRIGSNPATPAAWADLLIERLEREH